jgi:hypothetical protein
VLSPTMAEKLLISQLCRNDCLNMWIWPGDEENPAPESSLKLISKPFGRYLIGQKVQAFEADHASITDPGHWAADDEGVQTAAKALPITKSKGSNNNGEEACPVLTKPSSLTTSRIRLAVPYCGGVLSGGSQLRQTEICSRSSHT